MDDLKIFEEQNGFSRKNTMPGEDMQKENLPQYKMDCAFQEAREIFPYIAVERYSPFPLLYAAMN